MWQKISKKLPCVYMHILSRIIPRVMFRLLFNLMNYRKSWRHFDQPSLNIQTKFKSLCILIFINCQSKTKSGLVEKEMQIQIIGMFWRVSDNTKIKIEKEQEWGDGIGKHFKIEQPNFTIIHPQFVLTGSWESFSCKINVYFLY